MLHLSTCLHECWTLGGTTQQYWRTALWTAVTALQWSRWVLRADWRPNNCCVLRQADWSKVTTYLPPLPSHIREGLGSNHGRYCVLNNRMRHLNTGQYFFLKCLYTWVVIGHVCWNGAVLGTATYLEYLVGGYKSKALYREDRASSGSRGYGDLLSGGGF